MVKLIFQKKNGIRRLCKFFEVSKIERQSVLSGYDDIVKQL